jgi:hypothetical protein
VRGKQATVLAWRRQPAGALSVPQIYWLISKGFRRYVKSVFRSKLAVRPPKTPTSACSGSAQTTVYHSKDFEIERRQATLVAILLDNHSTLIDEILDLHDRKRVCQG